MKPSVAGASNPDPDRPPEPSVASQGSAIHGTLSSHQGSQRSQQGRKISRFATLPATRETSRITRPSAPATTIRVGRVATSSLLEKKKKEERGKTAAQGEKHKVKTPHYAPHADA
jgi:hypothetical protein